MKKLGILCLSIGVFVMLVAASRYFKEKEMGSDDQVKHASIPFPWFPTVGGLLVAGGGILIATSKSKKV